MILPQLVPVLVDFLRFEVRVDSAVEDFNRLKGGEGCDKGIRVKNVSRGCSCRTYPGRKGEDDDVSPKVSNFKMSALNKMDQVEDGGPLELLGRDPKTADKLGQSGSARPNTKEISNFKLGQKR